MPRMRLAPPCWAKDLPPICFRVASWVPQNGFIGRTPELRSPFKLMSGGQGALGLVARSGLSCTSGNSATLLTSRLEYHADARIASSGRLARVLQRLHSTHETRPLVAFARLWTNGVRGTKANPVEGRHLLYGFLTTEPNSTVAPCEGDAGNLDDTGGMGCGCARLGMRRVSYSGLCSTLC